MPEHHRGESAGQRSAPRNGRTGEGQWFAVGGGGNASVFGLALAGDLSRRSLPHAGGGLEDGGQGKPDLRFARARGDRGSRDDDPTDERGAIFPATSVSTLGELA